MALRGAGCVQPVSGRSAVPNAAVAVLYERGRDAAVQYSTAGAVRANPPASSVADDTISRRSGRRRCTCTTNGWSAWAVAATPASAAAHSLQQHGACKAIFIAVRESHDTWLVAYGKQTAAGRSGSG
jgi:hypothetical protein